MMTYQFFHKGMTTFTFGNNPLLEKELGYIVLYKAITPVLADENTMAMGAKCAIGSPKKIKLMVDTLQKHMKDLKITIVERKDIAAQFGSAVSGKKTGIMYSWYKSGEKKQITLAKLNKWEFIRYSLNHLETYNALRKPHDSHDVLECTYEDYLDNPKKTREVIFNFLGVSDVEPTWVFPKKVMPPAREYIKNYNELNGYLVRLRSDYPFECGIPLYINIAKFISLCRSLLNFRDVFRRKIKIESERQERKIKNNALEDNKCIYITSVFF